MNLITGGFQSVNQFPSAGSASNPFRVGDQDFGWFTGEFAEPNPYSYVDPTKANEQIKALLEGAFGDEDEKPRTRRRKKEQLEKANELSDNLMSLDFKPMADESPEKEADGEDEVKGDEEDEEDDNDDVVEGLGVQLLPHQVVGVDWMQGREVGTGKSKKSHTKGGILADDMGLGKTIQTIALILTNPRPPVIASKDGEEKPKLSDKIGRNTMVIAPLALIKQWESEIKTKIDDDHQLRVLVHHGPQRTKRSLDLKKYDVVITTYQTLVSEHGSTSADSPFGCFGIHWYRIVLDEAHSIKNRNAKATKACNALRAEYRWCLTGTPLQNNLDELQSLVAFLRIKPYNELRLWKEHIAQPLANGRGELAIKRLQTILKAFMLRRTKKVLNKHKQEDTAKAAVVDGKAKPVFKLPGRKVTTVACKFSPAERNFYEALAQKTDQRIEQLMQGAKMNYTSALTLLLRLRQACDHSELVKRAIGADKDALSTGATNGSQTPRKTRDGDVDEMAAMLGGLSVGTKECDICLAELSAKESSAGMIRCSDCQKTLDKEKAARKKEKRNAKLRKKEARQEAQQKRKPQKTRKVLEDSGEGDDEGEGDWVIPEDERNLPRLGRAGGSDDENADGGGEWIGSDDSVTGDEGSVVDLGSHRKQKDIVQSINSTVKSSSSAEDEDESEEDSDSDSDSGSDSDSEAPSNSKGPSKSRKPSLLASAKIQQLVAILQREASEHKFIVFSQFTSMLDLVEPFLRRAHLSFVRYDGSMRNDLREASLEQLRSRSSTRVLLCSLKCGSLGLNLTAASRVVILEPFWNPFVEEQAIDRVHRLNQTRDVVVYRLTVTDTVEEKIFELQEKKRTLAEAAIEGGAAAKLTIKDMLDLFKQRADHRPPVGGQGPQGGMQGAQANGFVQPSGSRPAHRGQEGRKVVEDPVYGRRW